jgi:DNA-directed RNA polymerase subunit RPC12/RpoP
MGTKATIFMIFGIIFVIIGIITFALFAIGDANTKFDDEQTIGYGQFWTIGGKTATRITGEYTASQPVDVYVTTDDSVRSGMVWSLESLEDLESLDEGKTEGNIDYETPDSGKDYYLIFNNPNISSTHVSAKIEFQNEGVLATCLILGVIMLVLGIIFLFLGFRARKQSDGLPSQYPQYPMYQQPQQYQQPAQYPPQYPAQYQQQYQQPPQQPQPPPQPQPTPPPQQGIKTYNCPHCGKPFKSQIPQQPMVVSCPSCGGRTTIGT